MELITQIKQWFQEDLSGRINNIINILILLAILNTCSAVSRVEQRLERVQQQTSAQIQPIIDEEVLKRQIINTIISKLNEAK
jgi:hypothetical protein